MLHVHVFWFFLKQLMHMCNDFTTNNDNGVWRSQKHTGKTVAVCIVCVNLHWMFCIVVVVHWCFLHQHLRWLLVSNDAVHPCPADAAFKCANVNTWVTASKKSLKESLRCFKGESLRERTWEIERAWEPLTERESSREWEKESFRELEKSLKESLRAWELERVWQFERVWEIWKREFKRV